MQVPSQLPAGIRGVDAERTVHAPVTAIDMATQQVKVQTPAGHTVVLALAPAALKACRIGDPCTFTGPIPPRQEPTRAMAS